MIPEQAIRGDEPRPFTGAEYIESLRDGREVYIDGERVADVTTHPAFRNSVRSLARLYDALHDPATKDVLTSPTDTGSGGFTHKYFRVARSREELIAQQRAIAEWSRLTYGWMGRTPDYKASLMNTLGANAEYYGQFADNARSWYRRAQENVLFMNHAIVNPPVDRGRPTSEVKDVYVTIQRETDAGVVVSGAKVVATAAAHDPLQLPRPERGDRDLRPRSGDHVHPADGRARRETDLPQFLRARSPTTLGSPYDYPLSSRFDENDAIFVLDNVLIPWENMLVHRDPEKILSFYPRSGFLNGFCFQGCTRFAVKLDFICRARGAGVARDRRRRVSRQPGDAGRDRLLAQSVLVVVRLHGDQPAALGRRRAVAQSASRACPIASSPPTPIRRSRRSSRRSSPRR